MTMQPIECSLTKARFVEQLTIEQLAELGAKESTLRKIIESPINTPEVSCNHCTKTVPIAETIVCHADGRLFCSQQCRAAAEIFSEWQEGD